MTEMKELTLVKGNYLDDLAYAMVIRSGLQMATDREEKTAGERYIVLYQGDI